MIKKIPYQELEKFFTVPKKLSPFYKDVRIPRKLKKHIKSFCGVNYMGLTNSERLWYYLEKRNPNYKRFLIKQIVKKE